MAAGEGRRLRPLTIRWPKPLLPIDGRPVIATLLRELAAAGAEPVTIVTGHLAEQLEAFVGDGSAFGLDLRFTRQPRPDGSADAVRRAVAAGARPPLVVAAADTVFQAGDVGRFLSATGDEAVAALAVRRSPPPSAEKTPVAVADGALTAVKQVDPTSTPFGAAPLWWLAQGFLPLLAALPGPPFELRDAVAAALERGHRVAAVEIGPTRDLTRPEDLVVQNFPYLTS